MRGFGVGIAVVPKLLRFFVEHPNQVWSREQILAKVWDYDHFGGSRPVDVNVRRLRPKLGEGGRLQSSRTEQVPGSNSG